MDLVLLGWRCVIFADDLALLNELHLRHGPFPRPLVDVGGIERPCVADYSKTITAMEKLRAYERSGGVVTNEEIAAAQRARYLDIHRPLSFLCPPGEGYVIENPENGGLACENLWCRYRGSSGIGTAVLLSVLEHVANPFEAVRCLRMAMAEGGIAVVSVPFIFPEHYGPEDNFRYTPSGLWHVFSQKHEGGGPAWQILECDWRLDIPSEAGVLDTKTGRAQAVKSCYLMARAL